MLLNLNYHFGHGNKSIEFREKINYREFKSNWSIICHECSQLGGTFAGLLDNQSRLNP